MSDDKLARSHAQLIVESSTKTLQSGKNAGKSLVRQGAFSGAHVHSSNLALQVIIFVLYRW